MPLLDLTVAKDLIVKVVELDLLSLIALLVNLFTRNDQKSRVRLADEILKSLEAAICQSLEDHRDAVRLVEPIGLSEFANLCDLVLDRLQNYERLLQTCD